MLLNPPKQIHRRSSKTNEEPIVNSASMYHQTSSNESDSVRKDSRLNKARFHRSDDGSLTSEHVLNYLQSITQHSSTDVAGLLTELSCEETITDESLKSMEAIFQKYHQHFHLTAFLLPNNQLSSAAAEPLANIIKIMAETLLYLDIRHNKVGSEGIARLIQPLIEDGGDKCSLISLNIADNNLKRKASTFIADLLRKNKTLQELHFGQNPLKSQGLKEIINGLLENEDSQLRHLDLKATTLGGKGAGMKALVDLLYKKETIQSLVLSSNNLGAQGAIDIASALNYRNQLLDLNLAGNEIGPEGVTAIANVLCEDGAIQGYCHLKRLVLAWNQIRDEGCTRLAIALEKNSTLQHLDLSGNFIQCDGARQLARTFTINFCLQEVLLNDNDIGDDGALALSRALARKSCSIDTLSWLNNTRISERGEFFLEHVFRFRESLNTWLQDLQNDISADTQMSVNWWTLPSENMVITDWEIDFLAQALNRYKPQLLQSIWLTGEHITKASIGTLCEKYLAENPSLTRLYLNTVDLGPPGGMCEIGRALCTNSTLRVLSVSNSGLVADDAASLSVALKHNSTLERINLQGNEICNDGFRVLWEVIHPKGNGKHNHPSLKALNVACNGLSDTSMAILSEAGGSTDPLKELNFDGNCVTDYGALDLAKAVMTATTLEVLHIMKNDPMTFKGKNALRMFAPARVAC